MLDAVAAFLARSPLVSLVDAVNDNLKVARFSNISDRVICCCLVYDHLRYDSTKEAAKEGKAQEKGRPTLAYRR